MVAGVLSLVWCLSSSLQILPDQCRSPVPLLQQLPTDRRGRIWRHVGAHERRVYDIFCLVHGMCSWVLQQVAFHESHRGRLLIELHCVIGVPFFKRLFRLEGRSTLESYCPKRCGWYTVQSPYGGQLQGPLSAPQLILNSGCLLETPGKHCKIYS